MSAQPVHWGELDEDLLFDPRRYRPYAAAHHVAAHHWSQLEAGLPALSAGLDMDRTAARLPAVDRHSRASVEAAAILVEAIAAEAVVQGIYGWRVGRDAELDWHNIKRQAQTCRSDARERGCVGSSGVDTLLTEDVWVRVIGKRVLGSWTGIAALANALGRGRVLEADQVTWMLHL